MLEDELFFVDIKGGCGTLIPPHFHADCMEFIEVVKGCVDITVGLSTVRASEGEIVHLLSGLVHCAVAVGEEESLLRVITYRETVLYKQGGLDEQFLSLFLLPIGNRAVVFRADHPLHASLRAHMETAVSEWRGKEIFYAALVLSEISYMLTSLLRFYGYAEEDGNEYRNRMRIAPAVHHIQTAYSQRIRLEELAATLFLSPDHFGKLFRATVGLTPIEYINNVRVGVAMRLLASTELPIAEVSSAAGFSNANYFHKVFRDLAGIGPAALRKNWRLLQSEADGH